MYHYQQSSQIFFYENVISFSFLWRKKVIKELCFTSKIERKNTPFCVHFLMCRFDTFLLWSAAAHIYSCWKKTLYKVCFLLHFHIDSSSLKNFSLIPYILFLQKKWPKYYNSSSGGSIKMWKTLRWFVWENSLYTTYYSYFPYMKRSEVL